MYCTIKKNKQDQLSQSEQHHSNDS